MFLEKLEVQGFKSFANKNRLIFPGLVNGQKRGLTAIVGPNGSGKSNVADAVRWALGEQSLKTLRGKKSEDVIFSGSDQKQRLGLAEVSLHLNNSEVGPKKETGSINIEKEGDLDQIIATFPEIIITRRLYRNGDSEYLLNGSRVRLGDIQMLLAKANFGQKTYSVIGQGMVENFLTSSASERKDFFDEATGIKQFQIKRDTALNKLESSYSNLQQVDMLLTEIRPRLKSLTRSVEKLKRRDEIEQSLKSKQLNYYSYLWQDSSSKLEDINNNFLTKEKIQRDQEKTLDKLNEELNKIRLKDNRPQMDSVQSEIHSLTGQREQYLKQIARIQAESTIRLEARGKFDVSWLKNKKEELESSLSTSRRELTSLTEGSQEEEKERREADLTMIRERLNNLNLELAKLKDNIARHDNTEDQNKKLSRLISEFIGRLDELANQSDLTIIKNGLASIRADWLIKTKELNGEDWHRIKEIQEEIMVLTEKRQTATDRLNEERLRLAAIQERLRLAKERVLSLEQEVAVIGEKISKNSSSVDNSSLVIENDNLQKNLNLIDDKIKSLEDQRESLNRGQEKEKALMYRCQQDIQAEQELINSINSELNSLRVEAARQETRLEDLESNIRRDNLSLNDIKNYNPENNLNLEQLQKEIANAKNQLEQIGGIDPETEKEYIETKERYDFLSSQTEDLDKTINSLESVIAELDKNIKIRFESEFKVISEKFNEYFKILFNGGSAKIGKVLNEDENKENQKHEDEKGMSGHTDNLQLAENEIKQETDARLKRIRNLKKGSSLGLTGIDIQATPPGKKIQTVTMLSGGERALTAIALICAIISANPSPFVVLDEVDAALDESNSQRLAKILEDLSNHTQFIVITHNRACMKQASILYGVTMETDGVSKLLSVKLDEMKKQ